MALVLVASAAGVWTVRRSFPTYEGTIEVRGLTAPVTVYRDSYGVPQLYGKQVEDLLKAQGYVHAQDRFWDMDFRRHVSSGRLAELFGPSMLETDAYLRTLGWRRVVAQEWQLVSPQTKSYLQAYADGVNAWIGDNGGADRTAAKSLEYALLRFTAPEYKVEPWTPLDSLAWLKVMAWELRGNMGAEMTRSILLAEGLSRQQINELYPPYPFTRNPPIVEGGAVVDGAFDAAATPPDSAGTNAGNPVLFDEQTRRHVGEVARQLGRKMHALPDLIDINDGIGIGSNSWVVSGSLTESGKPLLASDPHLSPSMPGVWYQIGLHCSCSYNVVGVSLAGVPGVIIGHNDRIAWGLSNLGPDVMDFYLEKIDGDRYHDGASWRLLETRRETLKIAGEDPVTITVRATKHGPLLSDRSSDLFGIAARPPVDPSGSPIPQRPSTGPPSIDPVAPGVPPEAQSVPYGLALRWTALDPGRTIEALFALNTADNWTQFREAAALFDVPAQSMTYADVDGNIGYQAPGRIPIRGKGDGRWPAPGWDPAYDWTGFIPFAELPYVLNPPSGIIVSANQAVVGPRYPHPIAVDWTYGNRSHRISAMLSERLAKGKLDAEDMRQMQFDNYHGFAPALVPKILDVQLDADDTTLRKARDLLRDWDFQQSADSAAAAFYNATWRHLLLNGFEELPESVAPRGDDRWWEVVRPLLDEPTSWWWDRKTTPETESMTDVLRSAMTDAAAELTERLGDEPSRWRWGDLHTLTLANDAFGLSGIGPVEWLFNHEPVAAAGGIDTVNATGWPASEGYEVNYVPSMRMIVDMADLNRSRWVNLSGNSGHAFHRNYDDQVELWRTGRNTPMYWNRPSVEGAAMDVLTLHPRP
ncbi:penicillin amidase [Micromonospora echinospora]|uniref:Penicillin amidase n=1 Tax=Micromonospora echinospora TaxID=1877 RepID=A0A1C4YSV5_MICEC|nr:penicillin acylase family protein [Micromonospora echinospora]SCF23750.1 penicillin amidase [Micromonospora echinospora]